MPTESTPSLILRSARQLAQYGAATLLITAVTGSALQPLAAAPYLSSDAPPAATVNARLRNGNTGYEAALFSPGNTSGDQLNPAGAPIWNYSLSYNFQFTYSAATGTATLQIDFNRDGDYLDAAESTSRVSSSLRDMGCQYVCVVAEGNGARFCRVDHLTINGTNLGSLATTTEAQLVSRLYEDSYGFFGNVLVTGSVNFTGNGGQERPRLSVQLGSPRFEPGLIGAWPLGETSGAVANDISRYEHEGTISGGPNRTVRCNGDAVYDFNGSSQYISVPSAAHLEPTSALTISGWICGNAWGSGSDVDTILRKGEHDPNNYQLAINESRVTLMLDQSDDSGFQGSTVLQPGVWYHVAATWDGAVVRIYLNGKLDNVPVTRTGAILTDTRPLYIGGRAGADCFDGQLYDVRIYYRALTTSEIAALAGLPGEWKFSEGSGAVAADSSGAGNNATLVAGAGWATDCSGNKALTVDGIGGIAQTASSFDPPERGAVAFWMKPTDGAVRRPIFGVSGDWECRQEPDETLTFDLGAEGEAVFVTMAPLNDFSRWYHVAANFDAVSNAYSVYIDGLLHKSGVNSNDMVKQAAATLSFGTRTGSTEYWAGELRDFRVYNRQLCPTEVAEIAGLAGTWKFDETAGTTANDLSPWGRHGAVSGAATWAVGKLGNALQLNGFSYVTVPGLAGKPRNVTLAAWAHLTGAGSGGAELISIGDYLAIRLDSYGNTAAFFYNGSTWPMATANYTCLNAGWKHFAVVFDDDNNVMKLYVDGVEAASLSTTNSIVYDWLGSNIVLGRHGNGDTLFNFTGKIDDARVYTRALCPTQIQQLVSDGGGAVRGVRILKWVETR